MPRVTTVERERPVECERIILRRSVKGCNDFHGFIQQCSFGTSAVKNIKVGGVYIERDFTYTHFIASQHIYGMMWLIFYLVFFDIL